MTWRQNQGEGGMSGFFAKDKVAMELAGEAQGNEESDAFGGLPFGGKTAFEKMFAYMCSQRLAAIHHTNAHLLRIRIDQQGYAYPTLVNRKVGHCIDRVVDKAKEDVLYMRTHRKNGHGSDVHPHVDAESTRAIPEQGPGSFHCHFQIDNVLVHFLTAEGQDAFHKFPTVTRCIGKMQIALAETHRLTELLHFIDRQLPDAAPEVFGLFE